MKQYIFSVEKLFKIGVIVTLCGLLFIGGFNSPVSAQRFRYARPVPVHHTTAVVVRPAPVVVRPVVVVHPVPYHYPYFYHPFVPYVWGPYWHPVGFFVATLTTAAIIITIENASYNYDNGTYYEKVDDGYKAVPAPVGATIDKLPSGYTKIVLNDKTYYYYGGDYYEKADDKYKVVKAPEGIVVPKLPEGAKEQTIDGQKYVIYNGVYYQPISKDGEDAYVVVEKKG